MVITPMTQADYLAQRLQFIEITEAREPQVYLDDADPRHPTIGFEWTCHRARL